MCSVLMFFCCSVVLRCPVVVAISLVATDVIYLHDISLMYTCEESAPGVEGGVPGQRTWHTLCPYPINRYRRAPTRTRSYLDTGRCIRFCANFASAAFPAQHLISGVKVLQIVSKFLTGSKEHSSKRHNVDYPSYAIHPLRQA
jgi:hypothetical protein